MKVLALAVNWQGFTVETLYHEQRALQNKVEGYGGTVFFYGPGYDYPTSDVSSYVDSLILRGDRPDVIISYLSERLFFEPLPESVCLRYALQGEQKEFPRGVDKVVNIPKVMWINDFWHMTPEQWDFTLLGHGFSDVVATYCPPFLSESHFRGTYSPLLREQIRFHPNSRGISPALFTHHGEPRDIDVSLLGARGAFYPLRDYFHESLVNQSWLHYFSAPHPGYSYEQAGKVSGTSYAKVLSRSKIFVSCTGRFSLPFIKIFEVLASGALLVCDRPCGAEELGLVDGETYVEVDRVNFLEKVHYYLKNDHERQRIASAGRDLFLRRHTTERNAGRMFEILAKIVERQAPFDRGAVTALDAEPRPETAPTPGAEPLLPRFVNLLSRGLGSLLNKSAAPAASPAPMVPAPWEEVKGGSCLNWESIVEVLHALEICQLDTFRELALVEKFGLNLHWSDRPVLTQFPETIAVRAKILKLLAAAMDASVLCEVGTARGLQSLFWADYLLAQNLDDATVATCDIVAHDEPRYRTPLTGDSLWTRRELWSQEPCASRIDFVHGDSAALSATLDQQLSQGRKLDLVYIDGRHDEEGAYLDFSNLRRHLGPDSVLVFDDCDPRFPGVELAVNRVASELDCEIRLVSFWPAPYKVAILNSNVPLSMLRQPHR